MFLPARLAGDISVGRLAVETLPEALATYQGQICELAKQVAGTPGLPTVTVTFDVLDGQPEEYTLTIDPGGVRIRAADGLAALHVMRTLVDLWDSTEAPGLPIVEISDSPSFTTRGVFVESYAGVDHMDLADWRRHIDRLAQLKFNTLGVSIYGCWDMHHGQRSEWLFTTLDEFPELRSPRRLVTWDPPPNWKPRITICRRCSSTTSSETSCVTPLIEESRCCRSSVAPGIRR